MGETNEEPMLFSQIEYFELMSRLAQASRETRASYIRLEDDFADYVMRQYKTEGKKDFKFLTHD